MDLVELKTELEELLANLAPNFDIGFSDTGEIIIATGLLEDDDGEIVEMDLELEEDADEELMADEESLDALEEEENDDELI